MDGVLFDKTQTTLILCPWSKAGTYTIPSSVTNIGMLAFVGCPNLTSVMVGGGVTRIENGAFKNCNSLAGAYFKGDAPSIGLGVFGGDDKATVYYVPGAKGWGSTFGGRPTAVWNP